MAVLHSYSLQYPELVGLGKLAFHNLMKEMDDFREVLLLSSVLKILLTFSIFLEILMFLCN